MLSNFALKARRSALFATASGGSRRLGERRQLFFSDIRKLAAAPVLTHPGCTLPKSGCSDRSCEDYRTGSSHGSHAGPGGDSSGGDHHEYVHWRHLATGLVVGASVAVASFGDAGSASCEPDGGRRPRAMQVQAVNNLKVGHVPPGCISNAQAAEALPAALHMIRLAAGLPLTPEAAVQQWEAYLQGHRHRVAASGNTAGASGAAVAGGSADGSAEGGIHNGSLQSQASAQLIPPPLVRAAFIKTSDLHSVRSESESGAAGSASLAGSQTASVSGNSRGDASSKSQHCLRELQVQSLIGLPEAARLHMALVHALTRSSALESESTDSHGDASSSSAAAQAASSKRNRMLLAALACSSAAGWFNYWALNAATFAVLAPTHLCHYRSAMLLPDAALTPITPSTFPSPIDALEPGASAATPYVVRVSPPAGKSELGGGHGINVFTNAEAAMQDLEWCALAASFDGNASMSDPQTLSANGMTGGKAAGQLVWEAYELCEAFREDGPPKPSKAAAVVAAAARLDNSLASYRRSGLAGAAASGPLDLKRGLAPAAAASHWGTVLSGFADGSSPTSAFSLALNEAAAGSVHHLRELYPLARLLLFRSVLTFAAGPGPVRDNGIMNSLDADADARPAIHVELEAIGPLLRFNWIVDAATPKREGRQAASAAGNLELRLTDIHKLEEAWPPSATAINPDIIPAAHIAAVVRAYAVMAQLRLAAEAVPDLLATASAGPDLTAKLHDLAFRLTPLLVQLLAVRRASRKAEDCVMAETVALASDAASGNLKPRPESLSASPPPAAVRAVLLEIATWADNHISDDQAANAPKAYRRSSYVSADASPEAQTIDGLRCLRVLVAAVSDVANPLGGLDWAIRNEVASALRIVVAAAASVVLQQLAQRIASAAGVDVDRDGSASSGNSKIEAASASTESAPLSIERMPQQQSQPGSADLASLIATLLPDVDPALVRAAVDVVTRYATGAIDSESASPQAPQAATETQAGAAASADTGSTGAVGSGLADSTGSGSSKALVSNPELQALIDAGLKMFADSMAEAKRRRVSEPDKPTLSAGPAAGPAAQAGPAGGLSPQQLQALPQLPVQQGEPAA